MEPAWIGVFTSVFSLLAGALVHFFYVRERIVKVERDMEYYKRDVGEIKGEIQKKLPELLEMIHEQSKMLTEISTNLKHMMKP